MTLNDLTAAASVFGPTGVAILYLIYLHSKTPAQKGGDAVEKLTDAVSKQNDQLAAIRERLVRIETRLDLKEKE